MGGEPLARGSGSQCQRHSLAHEPGQSRDLYVEKGERKDIPWVRFEPNMEQSI